MSGQDDLAKKTASLSVGDKTTGAASSATGSSTTSGAPARFAPAGPAKAVSLSLGGAAKPAVSVSLGAPAATATAAKPATPASKPAVTATIPEKPKAQAQAQAQAAAPAPTAATTTTTTAAASSLPAEEIEKKQKGEHAFAIATSATCVHNAKVKDDFDPFADGSAKEHLNIIFLGHVDAGKSTMGGHLLFLTGMVDKRTMEKYEKEAKELEYGRGYFETELRRYTIIDAPGHKNFVPSMLEGAAQADVGVLVISARKGEFETGFEKGGQTREHVLLAKTAGVKRLIIVINKMDDPTVGFSKERYDECVTKILPFVKGVGYQKNDIDVMPVSGFTGANLKDPVDPAICDWYTGPPLLTLLNEIKVERNYSGPLIMPIADKLKDMGTVVLGKLESGSIKTGQKVLVMPNRRIAEVSAIIQEETETNIAYTGENVRVRLRGVEEEDVLSGFVICDPKKPVHAVTAFEAQIAIMEYKSIMCAGYTAVMHMHTAVEEVSIAALLHMIDKKTNRKSKHPPKFVKKGDACIVRIETTQSICA
eukprot:jgi/Hompol1/1598/HPOL_005653-RA